jgi:hypothetical protein
MEAKTVMRLLLLFTILTAGCYGGIINIVQDPSFELASDSWLLDGFSIDGSTGHLSDTSAVTGCVSNDCVTTLGSGAFVSQTLATSPGQTYDLCFWVTENSGPTSEMSVFWNGTLIADVLNPNNHGNSVWKEFSFAALPATGSATVLEVHGRQDPAAIFFDDFSVPTRALRAYPNRPRLG